MAKGLTLGGFSTAVDLLKCEAAALRSVLKVESRGSGFDRKGRVLILFEPHVFHEQLMKHGTSLQLKAAIVRGVAYPTWGEKPYPADSYPTLLSAIAINPELAHRAASWGAGQLLGRNFKLCGYDSATKMADDFTRGEDVQLLAMACFIAANPRMLKALQEKDWETFALCYNGKGYKKNRYHLKLAAAYAEFRADPLRGLKVVAVSPSVGQTQVDVRRSNIETATGTVVATGAGTGAALGGFTVKDALITGGVILSLALVATLIINRFSALSERNPQLG